jgi:transposase-like protein
MLKVITTQAEAPAGEAPTISATLDDLARDGARRMIAAALQLEAAEYVARFREARDEGGRALVVRNGTARPRPVTTGVGPVTLAAPRVNDRRVVAGVRQKFTSMILPPYVRRSPRVESVLPLLYLHGLSSGDFREALPALLGPEAAGLSSSAILRLTKSWTAEYEAFRRRDLADRDYIYLWADGVHFTIRLEAERLCTLVVIGVRPDGTKEVVALEDGYRESAESWRTLLRDLKRRGLRAPVLAVGDGALGFWAACGTCGPRRRDNAVGCIGSPMCWISSPEVYNRGPSRRCTRSCTRRHAPPPSARSFASRRPTRPSIRRPPRRSPSTGPTARVLISLDPQLCYETSVVITRPSARW